MKSFMMLALLALTACAHVETKQDGSYAVSCGAMVPGVCTDEAIKLCPNGYTVNKSEFDYNWATNSGSGRVINITCK